MAQRAQAIRPARQRDVPGTKIDFVLSPEAKGTLLQTPQQVPFRRRIHLVSGSQIHFDRADQLCVMRLGAWAVASKQRAAAECVKRIQRARSAKGLLELEVGLGLEPRRNTNVNLEETSGLVLMG